MHLVIAENKKQKKAFLEFRKKLYQGDSSHVCTDEFMVKMFLHQTTYFTRTCFVKPIMVIEEDILAECILINNPALNLMQVAFFEALPNQQNAVNLLLQYAKEEAKRLQLAEIVVGLNGHISYGVGILTQGFQKISFDSIYNKPYYADYFSHLPKKQTSTAYRDLVERAGKILRVPNTKLTIRPIDFKRFEEEMELFRFLCEKTISKTFLYYPTEKKHFYELIKDLKVFLKPENILFAEFEGQAVGFLFWYPDFNQTLCGGKQYSLLGIGLNYLLGKKRIDTIKVNSIGVLEEFQGPATVVLLAEMKRIIGDRYRYLETTFVWDNNERSTKLNRHLLREVYRKYEVYFDEV